MARPTPLAIVLYGPPDCGTLFNAKKLLRCFRRSWVCCSWEESVPLRFGALHLIDRFPRIAEIRKPAPPFEIHAFEKWMLDDGAALIGEVP